MKNSIMKAAYQDIRKSEGRLAGIRISGLKSDALTAGALDTDLLFR